MLKKYEFFSQNKQFAYLLFIVVILGFDPDQHILFDGLML